MSAKDILVLLAIALFVIGGVVLNYYSNKLGKNDFKDEDKK